MPLLVEEVLKLLSLNDWWWFLSIIKIAIESYDGGFSYSGSLDHYYIL